ARVCALRAGCAALAADLRSQHLFAFDDLLAFAALALAEGPLIGVELVPAVPGRVRHLTLVEQRDDRVLGRLLRRGQATGVEVLLQVRDRLVGIALGRADQADRTTLDPPGDIRLREVAAVLGGDPARLVGHGAGLLVERQLGDVLRQVAHRAVDRLHGPLVDLAGTAHVAGAVEFGALGAPRGDLAVLADQLHRVLEEVQVDAVERFTRITQRVVLDDVGDLVDDLRVAPGDLGGLVVVDVLGVDD